MDKRLIGILAIIAAIFIGVAVFSGHKNNNSNSSGSASGATNHIQGSGSTGVKLMEYGDYECPVCEVYYPVVKQVATKYNSQIFSQFRNLPLVSVHPNAFAGARAAEAAGLQQKYWQMHDKLYDNQNVWASSSNPSTYFNQYAQELGLDLNKFKADYASDQVNAAINADLAAFKQTGQEQGTPTFFLDGKYISNTQLVDQSGQPSLDQFSKFIDAEIAAKQKQ